MNQSSNDADRKGPFGQALQVLATSRGVEVYDPVETSDIEEDDVALTLLQVLIVLHARITQNTLRELGISHLPLLRDLPREFEGKHRLLESWTTTEISVGEYGGDMLIREWASIDRVLAVRQVESEYLLMPGALDLTADGPGDCSPA